MSSVESIIVGTIVGVSVGIAAAVVGSNVLREIDARAQAENIADLKHESYNKGWNDASNHAGNVRQSYLRLHADAPDENEGTTMKTGRKG